MKKSSLLLFVLGTLCSFNLASQNLIKGGDMEAASQAYWTECGQSTLSDADDAIIWGDTERDYTHAADEFGTGGVLTVGKSWGECLYTISQPVELTGKNTYTASLNYSIADYNAAWVRVFIGTTDPSLTCPAYSDNQIGDLIRWSTSYNNDSIPDDLGNYTFSEKFTPATSGTYYFVIQFGVSNPEQIPNHEGYLNVSVDNVSLVANTPDVLIRGGDMEAASQQYWSEYGLSSFSEDYNIIWGDTGHDTYPNTIPGFGTEGVLTVREGWGNALYMIAQPVTLTAKTTYTASFDYAIGDFNKAWFQVFIGTTNPADVSNYTDNQIGDLLPWVTDYSQPGRDNYVFSEDFTPSTSGTYYFVVKWGCGDGDGPGYFTMFIDNVSLVVKDGTGIKDVNVNVNNAVVVGGKSSISTTFEGTMNIAVYSIQGQLIRQAAAQNAFRADNLPAGIYVVKVDNKAYKVIVR